MAPELVSVLVPAYNEAASLEELFLRTDAVMRAQGQAYEFIVIDDGSTDSSLEVLEHLRAIYPQIGMISHARNHGKSMGLMQGYARSRGDVIVTMDGDLQDMPEDIPSFLSTISQGYDLVGGCRRMRKDSAAKRFVSMVYNRIVKHITGHEFKDINCGFKAYTRQVVKRLELTGDMHRLIPAIAVSYGFRVTEIPVGHKPRRYGTSRYHLLRHRGLLDLVAFTVLRATQVRPFHVMSEMGLALLCVSFTAFVGVWLLGIGEPHQSAWRELLRFILGFCGGLFGLIGALTPMVGLLVECITLHSQGASWRGSLVQKYLPPRQTDMAGTDREALRNG